MATHTLAGVFRKIHSLAGTNECDAQLLQQFITQRDEVAFAALLQLHGPMVFAVCRQVLGDTHDAEDAFQATFLVLARKAGSVRQQDSLAAWLHRVALNIARTARINALKRQAHERQAVLMSESKPIDEVAPTDLQPVVLAEVDRLPTKYRVPVVLCYFEGKTHDEAARQLGWPLGTVKGRLSRARDLLCTRLTRRGLALSASGLTAALTPNFAMSQVPAALLARTLDSATLPLGVVSPQVLILVKGALPTMTALKWIPTILVVLAIGVGSVATALRLDSVRAAPPGSPAETKETPQPPEKESAPTNKEAPKMPPAEIGVEVAGLRAKISLEKQQYAVGAPIKVKYVVKNVSKVELTLWHSGFWPNHLILVQDAKGKEPPFTTLGGQCRKSFSPGGDRDKNVPWKVPAGGEDAANEAYDLTKFYDLSKPGRYTVQYIYEEKQGGWEGRLPSNEVAFEIVADPMK